MKKMTKCLSVFLLITISMTSVAHTEPVDDKEWLVCEKNPDCTSVKVGCYDWQPVNKQHEKDMEAKGEIACMASKPAGPQPVSICMNRICVNHYDINYWKQLTEAPDSFLKPVWMTERINECLRTANVDINWAGISKKTRVSKEYDYIELREGFLKRMDAAIKAGNFKNEDDLQEAIDKIVPCQEVVDEAQQYKE